MMPLAVRTMRRRDRSCPSLVRVKARPRIRARTRARNMRTRCKAICRIARCSSRAKVIRDRFSRHRCLYINQTQHHLATMGVARPTYTRVGPATIPCRMEAPRMHVVNRQLVSIRARGHCRPYRTIRDTVSWAQLVLGVLPPMGPTTSTRNALGLALAATSAFFITRRRSAEVSRRPSRQSRRKRRRARARATKTETERAVKSQRRKRISSSKIWSTHCLDLPLVPERRTRPTTTRPMMATLRSRTDQRLLPPKRRIRVRPRPTRGKRRPRFSIWPMRMMCSIGQDLMGSKNAGCSMLVSLKILWPCS